MESNTFNTVIPEIHDHEETYKLWLQALLDNDLQSVMALEAVRNESGEITDFNCLFINKKAEESIFHDLYGKYFIDVLSGDKSSGLFEHYVSVTETGSSWEDEIHSRYNDTVFWSLVKVIKLGEGCLVIFNDITERKKAEQQLKENQKYIEKITCSIPGIIYLYDIAKDELLYSNQQVEIVFGYSKREIRKMGSKIVQKLLHPDDLPKLAEQNKKLEKSREGRIETTEYRVRDKNKKWRWMLTTTTAFKRDENRKLVQTLGIAIDITGQKESQNALLKEKIRNFELKRINEVMDTFVFAAAHDLKSPVSNLKLLTNLIENTEDADTKTLLMGKFPVLIKALDKTISGLVKILEIHNESEMDVKNLYFQDILTQVTGEFHKHISASDAEINTNFAKCPSVTYVESYLLSFFRNLLRNAIKYRSEERKLVIDIRSDCVGKYIRLTISDNGIGIDTEKHANDLFKPFKRFTTQSKGSGIGLYLVKSMVIKNGGYIKLQSQIGAGTTFKIYLVPYRLC
jgi:two-component system, chemotaxis family, CheB/CheR fusion protein